MLHLQLEKREVKPIFSQLFAYRCLILTSGPQLGSRNSGTWYQFMSQDDHRV